METHNPLTAEGTLAAEAQNVLIKIDVYLVEQEQTQPYYTRVYLLLLPVSHPQTASTLQCLPELYSVF